jgi:hypothetical protein
MFFGELMGNFFQVYPRRKGGIIDPEPIESGIEYTESLPIAARQNRAFADKISGEFRAGKS